jgi:predicted amidohydrolase YtcJ
MLLYNGDVLTLDSKNHQAEAIAIADGRIDRVGTNLEIRRLLREGWKSIDLQGKTVLPGLIDSHVHFMGTALTAIGIDLGEARSIDEILAKVEERAGQTPPGDWIFGYFITHLPDRAMPTRFDIDRVSIKHPVRLTHRNGHLCSLNSKALEVLKIPKGMEGVEQGAGGITGVIRDPAIQKLSHPGLSFTDEKKIEALNVACRLALQRGVTTFHALDGGPRNPGATAFLLKVRAALPLKIVPYNQSMVIQEALDLGLPRIGGCICADGAFESHTAALFEPYADEPDHYGSLTYTQEEMSDFILRAHRAGLQCAVHCEADRAIEQVLYAYERALRDLPRKDHRHRIEHFEIPTENQMERVARAGVLVAMQPSFLRTFFFRDGVDRYEAFLGRARLKRIHPYKTMLSHGILMAGGSDSPVTRINPLLGIEAAVTHPHVNERLSVLEAIKLFTINGARFAFEEREKGSIESGKAADLVILSEDPCSVDPERIGKIQIEMTLVDGKVAFRSENTRLIHK